MKQLNIFLCLALMTTLFWKIDGKALKCQISFLQNRKLICHINDSASEFSSVENSSSQLKDVEGIIFHNKNISFISEEVARTFPKLSIVGFADIDLEKITFDWLENLLENLKNQTTELIFNNCSIKEVDPSLIQYFQEFEKIDFESNICIDKLFDKKDGRLFKMESLMSECTSNFNQSKFENISEVPEIKNQSLDTFTGDELGNENVTNTNNNETYYIEQPLIDELLDSMQADESTVKVSTKIEGKLDDTKEKSTKFNKGENISEVLRNQEEIINQLKVEIQETLNQTILANFSITEINKTMTKQNKDFKGLKGKVEGLETKFQTLLNLKENTDKITEELKHQKDKIVKLNENALNLAKINETLTQINETLANLTKGTMEQINQINSSFLTKIGELNETLTKNKNDISELKNDFNKFSNINVEIQKLRTDVNQLGNNGLTKVQAINDTVPFEIEKNLIMLNETITKQTHLEQEIQRIESNFKSLPNTQEIFEKQLKNISNKYDQDLAQLRDEIKLLNQKIDNSNMTTSKNISDSNHNMGISELSQYSLKSILILVIGVILLVAIIFVVYSIISKKCNSNSMDWLTKRDPRF